MKRVLIFEDTDQARERFRQLYNGLVTGSFIAANLGADRRERRKLEDAEKEAELHELLEAVSTETPKDRAEKGAPALTGVGDPMRELTRVPTELVLTQSQHDVLRTYLELFIPSPVCKSTNTRKAMDALGFLKAAPEHKPATA
jgi:hypothetical protein